MYLIIWYNKNKAIHQPESETDSMLFQIIVGLNKDKKLLEYIQKFDVNVVVRNINNRKIAATQSNKYKKVNKRK